VTTPESREYGHGLRGDAAESFGEGCLVADSVSVVAGGNQELAGDLDADPV
jgi:hypothetical protein